MKVVVARLRLFRAVVPLDVSPIFLAQENFRIAKTYRFGIKSSWSSFYFENCGATLGETLGERISERAARTKLPRRPTFRAETHTITGVHTVGKGASVVEERERERDDVLHRRGCTHVCSLSPCARSTPLLSIDAGAAA